jgi:hypothetical protein
MLSTQAMREQLDRYADGVISAESLEEWLASESWDMRRWAPMGLQRFVEALQANFIACSDGKISDEDLRSFLLQRRTQLHRAAEVTKELEVENARLADAVRQAREAPEESIAGRQAAAIKMELQPASA